MEPYLTILIPAYNEESSIVQTLNDYSKFFPSANFIVIDNNSNDKTYDTVSEYINDNSKINIELFRNYSRKSICN